MKILFIFLLGALFCAQAIGQTEQPAADSGVAEILLARDDGAGKPGEVVTDFIDTDVPIHCLITLAAPQAVTVKMNLVAVKANGLKPGASVVVASYTTKDTQNRVAFSASPDKIWATGKYRVDISLGGKLAKSLEFTIQSVVPRNNFAPKPPKRRGKTERSPRKD